MHDLVEFFSDYVELADGHGLKHEILMTFFNNIKEATSLEDNEIKAMISNALDEWDI